MEDIIKNFCKSKLLTIKDLALKIGMTESGLHYTLKNNTLKVETLQKIAGVLDIPIGNFFNKGIPLRLEYANEESAVLYMFSQSVRLFLDELKKIDENTTIGEFKKLGMYGIINENKEIYEKYLAKKLWQSYLDHKSE